MVIYNFDDFILESKSIGFPFILSETLVYILTLIDDPISKELLELNRTRDFKKYTIIDTNFNEDYVTFVHGQSMRDVTYANFDDDALRRRMIIFPLNPSSTIWNKGRSPIKIGRLVNNLFPGKFTNSQLELFINKFKSKNQRIENRFEVFNSVIMAYDSSRYSKKYGDSNQLWNSCMNDVDDVILHLYSHNDHKVDCLTLMEDEVDLETGEIVPKIIARALIWRLENGDLFMDRIYYIHDKDYYKFIDYAKENGIIYKSINKSGSSIEFIKNGVKMWYEIKIKIKYPIERYDSLPYLDTFYYAKDNFLMNYRPSGHFYKLNGTDGDFEEEYEKENEDENEDD